MKNLYKEKIIYLDGIWNSHSGINIKRKYNQLPSQNSDFFTLDLSTIIRKFQMILLWFGQKFLKKLRIANLY